MDLTVLEGSVEIRHRAPSKLDPALIREDTTVKVVDDELRETIDVNVRELVAEVSWLERRVALVGATTLGEAVQEFNRYNKVQLLLEGSYSNRQIRGIFNVDRPHDFVRLMETAFGVKRRVRGNFITIPDPEAVPESSSGRD
jgi:ferric-dicitrate binding protein FerR (iron transport regulator)